MLGTGGSLGAHNFMDDDDEDEDDPAEQETESMLKLMQEINHMREQGKNLSDEERRKGAEALIKKLGQFMNIGEDDEGDDDFEDFEIPSAAGKE